MIYFVSIARLLGDGKPRRERLTAADLGDTLDQAPALLQRLQVGAAALHRERATTLVFAGLLPLLLHAFLDWPLWMVMVVMLLDAATALVVDLVRLGHAGGAIGKAVESTAAQEVHVARARSFAQLERRPPPEGALFVSREDLRDDGLERLGRALLMTLMFGAVITLGLLEGVLGVALPSRAVAEAHLLESVALIAASALCRVLPSYRGSGAAAAPPVADTALLPNSVLPALLIPGSAALASLIWMLPWPSGWQGQGGVLFLLVHLLLHVAIAGLGWHRLRQAAAALTTLTASPRDVQLARLAEHHRYR